MSRALMLALLLFFSSQAAAAIPQAVTVVLHGAGGYFIALFADKLQASPAAGVGAAAVVGVAKEISDVNFNVPDALGWIVGAGLYHLGKANPDWCFESEGEPLWYGPEPQVCP